MANKYKGKAVYELQMQEYRDNYKNWKDEKKKSKSPFFMIYSSFKEPYLRDISGGALKLYIFLGFHVNTFTGECWVSADTISDFFGNDVRTVKKWFEELEKSGLISRVQTGYKRVANTFLLPYGEGNDLDDEK